MKKFYPYLFLALILCFSVTAGANVRSLTEQEALPNFADGRDYFSYAVPIPVGDGRENRILIQSFFDYDCRVCVNTQDILVLYSQINSHKVVLEEYPVATAQARFSARVFYSLQQMNNEDISDLLLFETDDPARYQALSVMDNLLGWLREQKIDVSAFKAVFNSEAVAKKTEEAIQRTEKYGVFTYPFVVIDGRFVLTSSTLYNDDYTFAVLNFLVDKITAERGVK
ncbi:thiol:disulfide interchange protein DsbA [Mesocricetibacter intestinalis]|uniref:Thiol:disulfide interchange protein DsbA n=1 Tax=Mesocricetibacter intestinalis TaxID=1521930 RepID=A0A4R6VBE0_9PAST|nr:thiol:disulfide interchange protein DsbA/DsbL [Mesocricetibacter intestinalis]TDQ57026.1 thiol:disulfide interchange protein DsbA [Mesocricetibacter intestinalis]